MKVLFIISAIFVASQADVSELVNGRYFVDTSGQYYPDESGRYYPDDSGRYIHVPNPYIHDDRPYVHTPDVFGPDGPGGPVGSETRTTITRTYLPVLGGPIPSGTANIPVSVPGISPPRTAFPPPSKPSYRGSGPFKWKLNLGDHAVENPNYSFQVDLPH